MNNTPEGINSRITEAEEQLHDLEDRMVKITATEQNIEKRMEKKKKEDIPRDLWDNIKCTNIHIRGSQKEKRERKNLRKYLEIIAETFPNIGKETVNHVQEAQRVPGRINPRRNTLRHIVIKLTKIKDRDKILKATREK